MEQKIWQNNFDSYHRIVDVAGAQGHFLGNVLKNNPHQTGILFDLPTVVQNAEKVLNAYNCLTRVTIIGGDFFQGIPQSGDLYVLCRTLLNWNDDMAIKILNECAKSLSNEAKLLIVDFMLPQKSHLGYLRAVLNDLNLMVNWNSLSRSKEEWLSLLNKTNLSVNKIIISKDSETPELFIPMILFECRKKLN
ncbi:MAG: hypothetical protein KIT27_06715 [Legionellales bacterium]|nr:hypothetical protein [Legionellales bacterium]